MLPPDRLNNYKSQKVIPPPPPIGPQWSKTKQGHSLIDWEIQHLRDAEPVCIVHPEKKTFCKCMTLIRI